jgi:U4/U6.U5 tri-snRNP-associated protein 2
VQDTSIEDICQVLDPKFSDAEIARFDTAPMRGRTLDGKDFTAGCMGLTSLASFSDPFNAVVQMLAHVSPIRDFFARRSNYKPGRDSLVDVFAITMRKLWNFRAFRPYVSPQALLQAATLHPDRHFKKARCQ